MSLSKTTGFAGIAAAVFMTGCATAPQTDTAMQQELENQRAKLSELEATNARLRQQVSTSGATTQQVAAVSGDGTLLPPNAKPGECYARVFIPPQYETATKQVLASEASETVRVIPAKYGMVDERILVREPGKELKVIPAKYGMVEEQVLVQEASERIDVVPAKYENVTERVMVSPAKSYWKRGRGPIEKVDNMTGEIMCLIEEPAVYRNVTTRKLVTPATTKAVSIPAKYTTVKKRVMLEPPKTVEVETPAQYKTVKVRKQVAPASEQRTAIPAKYQTVQERKQVADGRLEWRSILCETNANTRSNAGIVRRAQQALKSQGYYKGPIDGIAGPETRQALTRYQQAKGLASGGMTMESLRSLGVVRG